jgi:hypothetical protein
VPPTLDDSVAQNHPVWSQAPFVLGNAVRLIAGATRA